MELRWLKRKRRVSILDRHSPAVCNCLSCSELISETVLQWKSHDIDSLWTDIPTVKEKGGVNESR